MTFSATADLTWLFHQSHAALGLQSSFGPIVQAIMNGGASKTSKADSITESRLNAAHKYRQIVDRLYAIDSHHRDILIAAYRPHRYSPSVHTRFADDRLIGITPYTWSANRFFEEDGVTDDTLWFTWLEGVVARQEEERIDRIINEADRLLRRASLSYEEL